MPGQAGHDVRYGHDGRQADHRRYCFRLAEKTASDDVLAGKAARETGISAQILDVLLKNRPLNALHCARRRACRRGCPLFHGTGDTLREQGGFAGAGPATFAAMCAAVIFDACGLGVKRAILHPNGLN